jgi:predicted permease
VYDRLLIVLPPDAREHYARLMVDAFDAYYQRRRANRSVRESFAIWCHALVDVLYASVMFRIDRHHARVRARSASHAPHSRNFMATIADILRHAGRRIRRRPGHALTCAVTLAIGLGTALATLTVLKHAFVDALPYESADRLMAVWTRIDGQRSVVSMHVFEEFRQQARSFSDQTAFRAHVATWTGSEITERITGTAVSERFFTVFGVRPALGQAWSPGERNDVVISWSFWQRALSGSPGIVGETIVLDGIARRIVGVMPADFTPPFDPASAFWMPVDVAALLKEPRARRNVYIVGRLAPASTPNEANAELDALGAQLRARLPVIHGQQAMMAEPLRDALVDTARPMILAAAGGAALLVLVVAANIAGLSAARAVGLREQTRLRIALGAGRGRLVGEQIAEALVIAVLGCVAGTLLAMPLVQLVASYQSSFLPRMSAIDVTTGTVAIVWAIGLVTCCAAVVLPYLTFASSATSRSEWLRGDMRTSTAGHRRVRAILVSFQVALALALVASAALLVRTMYFLSTRPLGFDAALVSTFSTTLPSPRYRVAAQHMEFERAVLERLRALPGITSATVGGPLAGGMGASITVFGQPQPDGRPEIGYIPVSPGFLKTYGIRLLEGRDLAPTDTADTEPVVLINETMARRFWPGGRAVGGRVRIGPDPASPWITVAGVIADVRQNGVAIDIRPTAYGSTAQFSFASRFFSVRVENPPASLPRDMLAVVRAVDPTVPVGTVSGLDEVLYRQLARQRLAMYVLIAFGATSLLLSSFGVYGVAAMSSRSRQREFAIRAALGARPSSIRRIIFTQAVLLATAGSTAGLALALAITRVVEGLLHGVTPLDSISLVAATLAVWGLSMIAAWHPARHAGRADPLAALKTE